MAASSLSHQNRLLADEFGDEIEKVARNVMVEEELDVEEQVIHAKNATRVPQQSFDWIFFPDLNHSTYKVVH